MKRAIKILSLIILVAILVYGGIVIYGNVVITDASQNTIAHLPDIKKAPDVLTIVNTGRQIIPEAGKWERLAVSPKKRYALHGFWEIVGQQAVYRKTDLILDEAVWGPIRESKRGV